nr:flippase [Methylobacterium sp. GC_Met_2]
MITKGQVRNYSINSIGPIINFLVAIITLPIYIKYVGNERYGVISIIWILLGYAGFLDLGLSRASENALAKATVYRSIERSSIIISTVAMNASLGIVGAFLIYVFASVFFGYFVATTPAMNDEIRASLPWVAAFFPLALVNGIVTGSLDSREKFFSANVISVFGAVIGQIVPAICAVYVTPKLDVVVPAAVIARAAGVVTGLLYVFFLERPIIRNSVKISTIKKLLSYGGWITVTSVVNPLLVSLDQFVIGSVVGIGTVTYYAVSVTLVTRLQIFATAMARTLFPRLSRAGSEEARELAEKAMILLSFGFALPCCAAILTIKHILNIWMGSDFSNSATLISQILLLGGWINGAAQIPFGVLQAQGRPDITAKFHAAELLPFAIVLWALASNFGLTGAAIAWSIRVTADACLMVWAAKFSRRSVMKLIIPAIFLISSFLLVRYFDPSIWVSAVVSVFMGILIACSALACNSTLRKNIPKLQRF